MKYAMILRRAAVQLKMCTRSVSGMRHAEMKKGIRTKTVVLTCLFLLLCTVPLFAISGGDALTKFRNRMYGIHSMRGMIALSTGGGEQLTGTFSYLSPGKIFVQFSNGKTIVSNGKNLWVYDPASGICGVQDLGGGSSGGIAAFVGGSAIANESASGVTIKVNSNGPYDEVTLVCDSSYLLKSATFDNSNGGGFSVQLSGVQTGLGLPSGMFDFSVPSSAQLVKNPLNLR